MSKIKLFSKVVPILLIVTIIFTACAIPDISKFTEQSTEMTRGIRKGIKDVESLVRDASERKDLYSDITRTKLKKNLADYKKAMKPTSDALDALDGYLEALNALSQASKKSEENSRAAVNAVGNLVTAATGLTFATEIVNVAIGIVKLGEDFRIARSFKKRVNLAAEIVEGVHPKTENGKVVKDENGLVVFEKKCTDAAGDKIVDAAQKIKGILGDKMESLTENQIKILKPLKPEEKRAKLVEWRILTASDAATVKTNEDIINGFGCGMIDLIKFNLKDLKVINLNVSNSMIDNIRDKDTTIGLYTNILKGRDNIRDELESIQVVENLIPAINENVASNANPKRILTQKVRLKRTLDNLFLLDSKLKSDLIKSIRNCGEADCGKMREALEKTINFDTCEATCIAELEGLFKDNQTSRSQFETSAGIITTVLDTRNDEKSAEDTKLVNELKRLQSDYDAMNADIASVKDKRDKLDSLLDSSISALDTWAETHANLRITVNTKQPLTVAKLTSKVKEIWDIINPKTN